jgi:hypothetical protein
LAIERILRQHGDKLSDWETNFLGSILRWRGNLTPAQVRTLDKIIDKVA